MPTETAASDFDLGDNEHLQKIINSAANILGERITALEQALEAKTAAHRQAIEDRDDAVQKIRDLTNRVQTNYPQPQS